MRMTLNMTKKQYGTTVSVSFEHLKKLQIICKKDDRTMKSVVKIILEKHFQDLDLT